MAMLAPAAAGIGSGLSSVSTLLGVASSIAGFASNQSMANYQAGIATRNAQVMEENARQERMAGQIDQQEQDLEAAAIMAREKQQQGASGFETSSTGFNRRNAMLRILARRDASRIRDDADRRATSMENDAQGERETAANYKRAGKNALFAGLLNIGGDLLGGATLVNQKRANQITRNARNVSQGYA